VVVDTLSRKKYWNATFARIMPPELRREIEYLNLGMVNEAKVVMEVEPTLEIEIQEGQLEDAKWKEIRQLIRAKVTLCRNRCSRTFKTKLSRSPNCSSRIDKASHLEHFAPIVIFSIYSVELELPDRKVWSPHLC
jgi:hypothetical protein